MRSKLFLLAAISLFSDMSSIGSVAAQTANSPFARIGHIVVIFTENRSFDHVFGSFPGADGAASSKNGSIQVDADGSPLPSLPRPRDDARFPPTLPNAPFPVDSFIDPSARTIDPTHDFYIEQEQINGGKMDRFVEASNAGALVMGLADGRKLRQWELAREFTLADHFFHAAFGGSFLNHFYLVCACAPVYPHATSAEKEFADRLTPALDDRTGWRARASDSPNSVLSGPPRYGKIGRLTRDYYAVGTMQPFNPLSALDVSKPEERLPLQTMPTIGDRLCEKHISWTWYAGGWNDVVSGKVKPYDGGDAFQAHHQPFIYFAEYAPGEKKRDRHLKDAADFFAAIDAGALPQVSFYKPVGALNGHPSYSDLAESDAHVAEVVARLRASPNWSDMLIVVAADENGGFWDHMAPPRIDAFGPGARVPALIISPFAKRGFVDHTVYDTTSILKTIEARFGLEPLTSRDAAANDLRNALEAADGTSSSGR
jgi:acid phosphatase